MKDKTKIPKIFWIIGTLVFGFILFWIINKSSIFLLISEIIKSNIGSLQFDRLKEDLWNVFVFTLYICLFLIFLLNSLALKKSKTQIIITISIITFIFLAGIFSIQSVIGHQNLKFNLQQKEMSSPGKIICKSFQSEHLLVDSSIYCDVKLLREISYNSILVSFTFDDNSNKGIRIRPTETFIAPPNVKYISFTLFNEDTSTGVSVGYPYKFYTQEEYESKKLIFMTSIISLLLLTLVTIPSAVLNFKKIFSQS